jgi:hypothetical protein
MISRAGRISSNVSRSDIKRAGMVELDGGEGMLSLPSFICALLDPQ